MVKQQQIERSGWFITLEGGEGAGKSSAIELLTNKLKQQELDVVVTREPGGVRIAEKIRSIILNPEHTEMDARTEALLYAAARRQHLVEVVVPAIERGAIVLCDRFVDSSLAYQGYARRLGMEDVWEINRFAIHDMMPDITFWLDIDPQAGLNRIAANQNREVNRLDQEQLAFHEAVREGYDQIAKQHPERIVQLDATQTLTEISKQMYDILCERTQDFAVRMYK
ncbi:dTMP kinase [Paenibacillus alvei]|uniref:Thymidylate kinase n=1 Tax=Paenibacillus alvei TaxID=44250 RepID=A0ABT4H2Q8_PAEAL|nr:MULTISPECIES: dTMP kinase [Paenibacillus]EJW18831.1 thymidylate kinase Tmk [Paenibacillus alvei DSM 29]MCY9541104.1 dTMP kinase [Paenibacillus alvei]MCY9705470.1 dTMP kinase [Paenibacillus alvei]MCY9736964.1 dTMP kinase [Paenibacillus alvei]MCY9757406.1 dTMP kinase [Paenibacillus alvei]